MFHDILWVLGTNASPAKESKVMKTFSGKIFDLNATEKIREHPTAGTSHKAIKYF